MLQWFELHVLIKLSSSFSFCFKLMKIWLLQNGHQVLPSFIEKIRWGVFLQCLGGVLSVFKERWDLFLPDIAPHCTSLVFLNSLIKCSHVFLQCCYFCFQCLSTDPLLSFFRSSYTALSFVIYFLFSLFTFLALMYSVGLTYPAFFFCDSIPCGISPPLFFPGFNKEHSLLY